MKKLNPNDEVIITIARWVKMPPLSVAYIRSALMRSDNKYDKQSLMYHIQEENLARRNTIKKLQQTMTEANIEKRTIEIKRLQKKTDFRQNVLGMLRMADDETMKKLLSPTI